MSKLTSTSHHSQKISDISNENKLRMVQSGIHEPQKPCSRCQFLELQLQSKETQILELRNYKKYMLSDNQSELQNSGMEDLRNIRKQLQDWTMKEFKFNQMIDSYQKDLQESEKKLNNQISKNDEMSQQNIDLRRQLLNLEQKLLEHPLDIKENLKLITAQQQYDKKFISSLIQMVKSCHPEDYFQGEEPTLKQTWKWLKNVLSEYMQLKQKVKLFNKQAS